MCILTLLYAAVLRRVSPSSSCGSGRRGASRHLAERLAAADAFPGPEAHAGPGAGADVGRRVGQPREVLRLGGRHREAHRRHGCSPWKRRKYGMQATEGEVTRLASRAVLS